MRKILLLLLLVYSTTKAQRLPIDTAALKAVDFEKMLGISSTEKYAKIPGTHISISESEAAQCKDGKMMLRRIEKMLQQDSVVAAYRFSKILVHFSAITEEQQAAKRLTDSLDIVYKRKAMKALTGLWELRWSGTNWGGKDHNKDEFLEVKDDTAYFYQQGVLQQKLAFELIQYSLLSPDYYRLHYIQTDEKDWVIHFYTPKEKSGSNKMTILSLKEDPDCVCGCYTLRYVRVNPV